jgi:hypothetical protein
LFRVVQGLEAVFIKRFQPQLSRGASGNVFVDDVTLECETPVANAAGPVRAPIPSGLSKHR